MAKRTFLDKDGAREIIRATREKLSSLAKKTDLSNVVAVPYIGNVEHVYGVTKDELLKELTDRVTALETLLKMTEQGSIFDNVIFGDEVTE